MATTFVVGDYLYTVTSGLVVHAQANNKTKASYNAIPSSVSYGGKTYSVKYLGYLTIAGGGTLPGCFSGCSNLVTAPTIPSSVEHMAECFSGCSSLVTAPTIPSSVEHMAGCFSGCSSLQAAPPIPSKVTDMSECFSGCSNLQAAPTIPNKVTTMWACFYGCSSLVTAPTIPSQVTDIADCFRDCVALQGEITINTSASSFKDIFYGTQRGIWLTGSSSRLQSYADTSRNRNVFIGEIPLNYNLAAERVDSDGSTTAAPEGEWLHLVMSLSWSRFSANSINAISLQKDGSAASLSWYTDSTKTSAVTLPNWRPFPPVTIHAWLPANTDQHAFSISVADTYHTGELVTILIPQVFRTIDFLAGGKGIAFGKIAEQEGFDCAMETFFDDQVRTSFESSVAMGSYGSSQTTIPDFVNEVRYSSGAAGSVSIGTAYTKDGVTIPAGWYNFMYLPHRTGGKNGQVDPAAIDNVEYGNLLLFGFASGSGRYDITIDGGVISKLAKLIISEDIRKSPTTSTHTKNVGKIAANTYKNCETNTITPTTAQSGLIPVVSGWDVQGTGTASCQIMGVYLSGNATNGYVGHIKVKNDSTSQIGDVTIEVRILWV